MVPNQITVISNYALVAQLGWRNTYQGIIIPLAGVAFGTFLMRNQFLDLPGEIIEAARLDGAGPMKLLWRVVMPMSWPTLVAFALITVVNEWNEYLWPFLMSDDETTAPAAGRADLPAEQRRRHQLGSGHGRHHPRDAADPRPVPLPPTPDDQGPHGRRREELNPHCCSPIAASTSQRPNHHHRERHHP